MLSTLKSKVLVDLLFRSRQGSQKRAKQRFDRIALAQACASSLAAASATIESLLHALRDSLAGRFDSRASIECAMALSHVLSNGGEVAVRALHELSAPSVTLHDVLQLLGDVDPRNAKGSQDEKKITSLDLPPTVEETQAVQKMVSRRGVRCCLLFIFACAAAPNTARYPNCLFADAKRCQPFDARILKLGSERRSVEDDIFSFKRFTSVITRR